MSDLDGAAILDEIADLLRRHVAFPSEHCAPTVALWAAHTWAAGSFYVTPRLVLDSAEPGSGKTRVLEVLKLVTRRPRLTISTTAAALYRRLQSGVFTILFDEVDALWSKNAGPASEDLRALLNSGYKKGATVDRCVSDGKGIRVDEFPVFAPAALAGLAGNLPATILTRAVVIHMRKRAPNEHVEPFNERDAELSAAPLADAVDAWMAGHAEALERARPAMPAGVVDRPAEVWEALLAVADAAGGHWPETGRRACAHFVLKTSAGGASVGVRLLTDLRRVFGDRDRMSTVDILAGLTAMEEAPWSDMWNGKALDPRRLAVELRRYAVEPVAFKDGGKPTKGYTTYPVQTGSADSVGLADAWLRYLPADVGNSGNGGNPAGQTGYRTEATSVTAVTESLPVTAVAVTGDSAVTPLSREVTPVTAVTANSGRCPACGGRRPRGAPAGSPLCSQCVAAGASPIARSSA